MKSNKPTYDQLKKKLAKTEENLARAQKNEINPIQSELDTAILSTKELAEAYLASEQNFKNSVDTCPLGIRIVTDEGELIYANKAALKIFGFQTVEELAVIKRQELFTPKSYAAHQERKKKRKLNQHVPGEYELNIRRSDGEVRNLTVFRREIMWGGEKQYMMMYEDITERKKAEEALKESEEKYHSLIEHSNDGIVFIEDGLINYCNSKMLKMGGYAKEDLFGKPFVDFIVPEQRENVAEIYKKRIAGMKVPERYELDIVSKEGNIVHTEVNTKLYYFRQKPVSIAVVRDITDRKKMDEALRQSEELFAKAFRSSPDAVSIMTLDEGIIVDMNDAAVKDTGYSFDELVGHSIYDLSPWVKQEDHEKIVQILKNNGRITQMEYQFRTKSGEIKTWEISAEPIVIGGKNCIISVQRNITDKRLAEEALKQSEEKFRLLSENSVMGTFIIQDNKIVYVNPSFAKAFGYSPEEIIDSVPPSEFIHPDDREFMMQRLADRYTGKVTDRDISFKAVKKDGSVIFIEATAVLTEYRGKPSIMGTFIDVTERTQAEEALKESEERYRLLFEKSKDAILLTSPDGSVLAANPEACRMFGRTEEEICRGGRDIVIDLSDPQLEEALEKRRETGEFSGELTGIRADGTKFPMDVSSRIFYNKEGQARTSMIIRDISERKRMEKALKESEERYHLLYEEAPVGYLSTAIGGTIIQVNRNVCEMCGYSADELIGHDIREFFADTPDMHTLSKTLGDKLKAGQEVKSESCLVHKNGSHVLIDTISRPVPDNTGKVVAIHSILTDITERKRAEEALQESEEKYKTILKTALDGFWVVDSQGKIQEVNDSYCEMIGYTREELLKMKVSDIEAIESPEETAQRIKKIMREGSDRFETRHRRKNGRIIDVEASINYLDTAPGQFFIFFHDITNRKKSEEALKESEERFNKAFHASPYLMSVHTVEDGRIIDVNEAYLQITGFERDEVIGKTPADLNMGIYPEKRGDFYQILNTEGRVKEHEVVLRTRSGEIKTMLFSAEKITLRGIDCMVVTAVDITERKKAEEALKESEERFNTAFHASPNMMAVITLEDGRFVDINAEHERITGYERQETIGKTALELNLWVHPEKRAEFYGIINVEDRLQNFEVLLRTKSGEIKTMLFSAEKITLRGINCLVVTALDITERKEAEERITHLNLTLRSIRNVSQVITREKDRSLLIQKICDTLAESRSFKGVGIILLDDKQRLITWAEANTSQDFPILIEHIKQNKTPQCIKKALKQKQVVITEEYSVCGDCPLHDPDFDIGTMTVRLELDGEIYGVLCAAVPQKSLIYDKEEIALFSEIAADISFALRDIKLVAANALREEEGLRMAKIESIGMLAGGIAHDFNNLLTGIMGNIGLVKTNISTSDPTYDMLDEAEAAAMRARDLTQQLLTFAKGGKPVKKLINPAVLIKESAEFALRGSQAKLVLSFPDDLWPIEADEGQITQVINNMIINADEAMPEGGTLKITTANLALRKSDSLPVRSGNYIRIDIRDTGTGMSPENLKRIFEPYFTTKQNGTGLGLTSAYSIVKNHGGILLVDSELNEGSTFHIYLPATKKALKGAKILTVDEPGQAGGKVLVMDDEEIIRKMLKNMLGMAGYAVELSVDGAEALEMYKQAKEAGDPFNAVIMDLTIPGGMGGKEAVQKLLEIDPKATVIVSSGYATDPIMSNYQRYGFKAVIAKPYSVRQLRELLSRLLTKKKR